MTRAVCLGALTLAACTTRAQAGPRPDVASSDTRTPATTAAATSGAPSAGPAPVGSAPAPSRPFGALEAARAACLERPLCSHDELSKLVIEARDRGGVADCELFAAGVGVPRDLARARACYARRVELEPPCGGSSPSLDRNLLATMLLDGQGGAKDEAGAHAAFAGCFEDFSVEWLFAPPTPRPAGPLDFCRDIGGTTLSMSACAGRAIDVEHVSRLMILKDLAAKLGPAGLEREAAAFKAFEAWSRAAAFVVGDMSRGGTLTQIVVPGEIGALLAKRNAWLATLAGAPLRLGDREKASAVSEHDGRLAKANAEGDTERKGLLLDAETAFVAYRRAEVAFAREAMASAGVAAATTDAEARTTSLWADTLRELDR